MCMSDSVKISYRVFPYQLNEPTRHNDFEAIRNNFLLEKSTVVRYGNKQAGGILDFGNMNYNGSFGRGISFGNSQDVVLNSSMVLISPMHSVYNSLLYRLLIWLSILLLPLCKGM